MVGTFCNAEGTHPERLLPDNRSVVRLDRLPSSDGMDPLSRLPCRFRLFKVPMLPSSGGIGPAKLLLPRLRDREPGELAQLRWYLSGQLIPE